MAEATVYVSIGNSDDKLTQREWHDFATTVEGYLSMIPLHGAWYSRPDSAYQNACWCVDTSTLSDLKVELLMDKMREIAGRYRQDSIAWATVGSVVFLGPLSPTSKGDQTDEG